MSLNQKFTNYVAEKNIAEIRDWLWARLSTSFEMFEKEIKYCKSQGVDIYQPHDNRDVDLPTTENSYNKLAGELKTNFSKERVNALIKIGRILYPKEEPKSIERHTSSTIAHSSIEVEKKKISRKYRRGVLNVKNPLVLVRSHLRHLLTLLALRGILILLNCLEYLIKNLLGSHQPTKQTLKKNQKI